MDRDHRDLCTDLPATAEALQHRPNSVGHAGVREFAGSVPLAAGGDVGVLSQGRLTAPRYAQPDFQRHDAVHARYHYLHGDHVFMARNDPLASELPLRHLSGVVTLANAELAALSAAQAAAEIACGAVTAEQYTRACLDRIAAVDDNVQAFAHLDPDFALEQARERDEWRRSGKPVGPLHGVPVAIKDIIDTADFPTECGSPVLSGRRPRSDATVVSRLRAAGAVIIGKTVTTEFAYFHPGPTRNPHDLERTPGGS